MRTRLAIGIVLMVIFAVTGVWLLSRPPSLAPETAIRQRALAQALAPAGPLPPAGMVEAPTSGKPISPVVVDLANIPPGVYDPNNEYDRWLRGEIDLDESASIVGEAELAALREASLNIPPDKNIQLVKNGPELRAPVPIPGLSFPSIDINGCCGGGFVVPPDPEMAAGPNHLVAVVNLSFAIYNKSGGLLVGPTTFASFFSAVPGCSGWLFDPNVLYDEKADRFMVAIVANGTQYCTAVSQTGNPTGVWNAYGFITGGGSVFFDYPHAGIGEDAIFVGANMFTPGPGSFVDSRVFALDKAAMYAGLATTPLLQIISSGESTPQPMNTHGWFQGTWPTDLKHYIWSDQYDGANYTIWEWDGPFHGPNTFASVGVVDLNAATSVTAVFPVNATQGGGGATITPNDWRPLDFEYRNGYGWTTMIIGCNPGGGIVDCVRWAQIDLNTITVGPAGAGVFATVGDHRIYPDLAANHCSDMAVGYTKTSSSIFPAVWYTGRENSDPAGTIQAEGLLKAGEIVYTAYDPPPHRWGDYSGMTIDPDGKTFWYLGEYSKITGNANGRWGNYVGSFYYPSCLPFDLGPPSIIYALPGSTAVHTYTLANHSLTESYQLTLFGNTFTTTLLTPSPLTVPAGTTATVAVQVDLPSVPGASDTFTLTAKTASTPVQMRAVTGTTIAAVQPAVIASTDMISQTGAPGSILTYTLTVTNTGGYTDTFDVSFSGNTWTTTVQMTNTGSLGSGQSTTVELYVEIGAGSSDTVSVTFTSRLDPTISASVALTSYRASLLFLPVLTK